MYEQCKNVSSSGAFIQKSEFTQCLFCCIFSQRTFEWHLFLDFLQHLCPLTDSKGLTVSGVLCWGSANQLGNICCPSGKVKGVTVPGLDVHFIPRSSPSWCKALPPLGAYRPCRHNHRTATIGSQKLALIYTEPWDGLRLSVHQSVSVSCLDRTQAALDLSYRLRQAEPRFLIGPQRRPAGPSCCLASWLIC